MWEADPSGQYSVKSAYSVLRQHVSGEAHDEEFKELWKLKVLSKVAVFAEIIQNHDVMGCYAGYTATLLKNLLAGVLSYSSFKYLKVTVLQKTKQSYLEPVQSVLYGTLARAISTS